MSFAGEVKEELARTMSSRRHCMIAEIAAIYGMCGKCVRRPDGKLELRLSTENVLLARKTFTLIKKTFKISTHIDIRRGSGFSKSRSYLIRTQTEADAEKILSALKNLTQDKIADPMLIQNDCCRRAFLRGAFLSAGSMNDPEKSYHFEIVCENKGRAQQLEEVIRSYEIDAKTVERKGRDVVYVKEGTQIVDLLNIMGAYNALMKMENVRILKDMRNQVNRQVNCETANLNKTVQAANKQIEQINKLMAAGQFAKLPDSLREIAEARMEHPDASLKELGEMLNPPIGRSGVNHRLKKIGEIAEQLA
jgi:cell division protein WhiA